MNLLSYSGRYHYITHLHTAFDKHVFPARLIPQAMASHSAPLFLQHPFAG
ncbi:hypothetical protein [Chryseobacterium sp. FH2]|nr:hypothetical protein [Chryseobacterium sp. FH2]